MNETASSGSVSNGETDELGALGVPGSPTGLSCPHCGGVLGEQADADGDRLECRIGHVVLLDALLEAKATAVEDALWASVRALHEKAALNRRLSQRAQRNGDLASAERLHREADAAERRADIVQDILIAAEH